jgi:quinol monooxygenase YgiN
VSRLGSLGFALLLIAVASAGDLQAPEHPVCLLTYIDVLPEAAAPVRELLVRYLHTSTGIKGRLAAAALEEIGRPERFALLEFWDSEADGQAQRATPAMVAMVQQLAAFSAGYEDRRFFEARTVTTGAPPDFAAPVQSIAHLDLVGPVTSDAGQFISDVPAQLRLLPGNLGAALLPQLGRGNHLSLWAQWHDESSWRAALGSALSRRMRSTIGPHLGSPYDERLYQLLQ